MFHQEQRLNDWAEMLEQLYSSTQNYGKTQYEIHSHLMEVCGVFAKHQFKRNDSVKAVEFLPKIFAWAVALLKKVNPRENNLEDLILRKFPCVCPYCACRPCECWKGEKPTLDAMQLDRLYHRNTPGARRSINEFQKMFRETYADSWRRNADTDSVRYVFVRMIEELAEVAEAVRFHHLYPENFENELADFFAWWFALVSCVSTDPSQEVLLASEVLWKAYPGACTHCQMLPCFCRPGPVRELISKPTPGQSHRFDALTGLNNQGAYKHDLSEIASGRSSVAYPLACARLDLDDFKAVNSAHGHNAGDEAIRHVASILQRKVRESDRVYRVGGDEFAVLFFDYTGAEAGGLLNRVLTRLRDTPVRWVSSKGEVREFNVTVSVGVTECTRAEDIDTAFEEADAAAELSKKAGKARVTVGLDGNVRQSKDAEPNASTELA